MTDNEIIKALERCSDGTGKGIIKATLDLINRQKEQIEGLIAGQETLHKFIAEKDAEIERLKKGWKADVIETQNIKSEAVKEFAERLKALDRLDVDVSYGYGREHYTEAIAVNLIDNLVKEIIGE